MNWKKLKDALGIQPIELPSDYTLWRQNKYVFNSSKTTNSGILKVYGEILEHEFYDSDYWSCGGNEIIIFHLQSFNAADWSDLEDDLVNWKVDQLEIFSGALTAEYDQNGKAEALIIQRAYFYGYILTIVDTSSAIELMDKFEFIKKGGAKPKSLLHKLNLLLDKIETTSTIVGTAISKDRFICLKSIIEELK